MTFAYKLQELRKGSGMSQEEFAELLGVSRQSVSKWESGKGYPEIDKLIFISNYFNTSLDLLLKETLDDRSSTSTSKRSTPTRSRKSQSKVCITKSEELPTEGTNPQTAYASDPKPTPKVNNYPIGMVSVPHNAQLRTVHTYQFGKKNRKQLSRLGVVSLCVLGSVLISSVLVLIASTSSGGGETYSDVWEGTSYVEEDYGDDVPSVEYSLYSQEWKYLYNDEAVLSDVAQTLLDDINYQEESMLVDNDGNVYYTSYEAVTAYQQALSDMRSSLDCSELYSQYTSFETYQNQTFLEVYSYDLDEWIVINGAMLRVYPNQYYYDDNTTVPLHDDGSNYSIGADYWDAYNTYPFSNVFLPNEHSYAIVSDSILSLCSESLEGLEWLDMSIYVQVYQQYLEQYELVNYNGNTIFVPKEYIMTTLSSQEEAYGEAVVEDGDDAIQQVVIESVEDAEEVVAPEDDGLDDLQVDGE